MRSVWWFWCFWIRPVMRVFGQQGVSHSWQRFATDVMPDSACLNCTTSKVDHESRVQLTNESRVTRADNEGAFCLLERAKNSKTESELKQMPHISVVELHSPAG